MQNISKLIQWNRLAFETSPYLLQHATNPVNWYAWGDEAFQKAQLENKPVMVSIGYSTCHWCHVMEHECFEDKEVAELLNKYFIAIKVDREERPDIDHLYMNLAQSLIGRGGWPLNVFLTPDKKIFHASTYVPKYSRRYANGTVPGMMDLIPYLGKLWSEQNTELLDSANNIMQYFAETTNHSIDEAYNHETLLGTLDKTFTQLAARYDHKYGGFSSAPKFPSPHNLYFLLNYYQRKQNSQALEMAETSLKQMRYGGMFDHVGLGFHRYSTDARWFLPHFEKMLYDQATLLIAYAQAYSITQEAFYKQVTDEIFTYVCRDMMSEDQLFYSAEDADSEGEEGKFYTWTYNELSEVLDKKEIQTLEKLCEFKAEGNFIDEASHEISGRNLISIKKDSFNSTELKDIFNKLYNVRLKRIHPFKDDKLLSSWNALLIGALAKAYQYTQDSKYLKQAETSITALLNLMLKKDSDELYASSRQGKLSSSSATLSDYSFMIWALLQLFKNNCQAAFLEQANKFMDITIEKFWDKTNYGFYFSDISSSELPINSKEFYDGAIPSANSIMLENLWLVSQLNPEAKYKDIYEQQVSRIMQEIKNYTGGYTYALSFLETSLKPIELACKMPNFLFSQHTKHTQHH